MSERKNVGDSSRKVDMHVLLSWEYRLDRGCAFGSAGKQPRGIASLCIIVQARQTTQSWLATAETIAAVRTIRARRMSDRASHA
jgi:hypothetical protein